MEHRVTNDNNFIYFTLCLIVLLLSSAISESLPDGVITSLVFQGLTISTLVVAYISLDFGKQFRRAVGILFVLAVAFSSLSQSRAWAFADLAGLLTLLAFFVLCTVKISRRVIFSHQISQNHVVGSIAIYLMLGLIWTVLYLMALEVEPDALKGMTYRNWADSFAEVLYFSYVTLATLGYGDISPNDPVTRVLAFLQAITGTFYMAIVVASLVGAIREKARDNH
ncbi:MAG: potassium channel family protein [Pseudomonadota bacterium]